MPLLLRIGQGTLPRSVDSTRAIKVRTKHPVPPASRVGVSDSDQLGPAMSRWTQGVLPTNDSKNLAAVLAPPCLPPTFLRSATLLLSCSRKSASSGNRQA